jgi:hypothetical protein
LTSILSASFHTSLRWTSHSAPCGVHEYASVASVRPPCDVRKYLIGLGWNRLLALTTEGRPHWACALIGSFGSPSSRGSSAPDPMFSRVVERVFHPFPLSSHYTKKPSQQF